MNSLDFNENIEKSILKEELMVNAERLDFHTLELLVRVSRDMEILKSFIVTLRRVMSWY